MNLQVCQFDSSCPSTGFQPLSSWPILRSFKMVYLTGLWARCSSGTVGISLLQVHLPTLCLVKVQQCSVYNKCPIFISTSTRSLPIPSAQRSPSGITMYLKSSRRSAFLNPCSMREVRLRLVLCVPIWLCGPLLRLGTLACISAPECTRHCITHRKITIFLDPMTVFPRV
jgi:hypothetical protein